MALPVFQALGTFQANVGAVTVAWPAHLTNDIGILIVETANEAVVLGTNSADWTQLTSSPQGTGTAGGTAATRLTAFWSRATSAAMGSVGINDSGDHNMAVIFTVRGCVLSGNPINVTAGDVQATADTSIEVPGATTTVSDCLVFAMCATGVDGGSTAEFSGWTNADLANIVERVDRTVNTGNGGGWGVASGEKATAGAYGTTTGTLVNSFQQGRISFALMPPAAITDPTIQSMPMTGVGM